METTIDLIKVLKAITKVMPCDVCPYPCVERDSDMKKIVSLASCDSHWFDILKNMDTDKSKQDIPIKEEYNAN